MEKEEEVKLVSNLPYCLVADEILIRVPVRSLARFRCVCKPWLSLLTTDPGFATKQHQQRKTTAVAEVLISSRVQTTSGTISIYQLNYYFAAGDGDDHHDIKISIEENKISFQELAGYSSTLSNSVDGLLACGYQSVRRPTDHTRCHYLLNPSTREIVPLPPTTMEDSWGIVGFGYASNCYKLVRLFSAAGSSRVKFCSCEVLTVGGDWKYLGEAPTALPCSEPVFLNGSIHWLACEPAQSADDYDTDTDTDVIVLAFDVEDDEFRLMPVPEQERPSLLSLSELGGQLCVTVFHDRNDTWTIWVLDQYWTKLHVIFSTAPVLLSGDHRPIYPRLVGIEHGKVLFQNINDGPHFQPIYSYDPRTNANSC